MIQRPAQRPAPHVFRCRVCNAPACYGRGVRLVKGVLGTWYCREHVPPDFFRHARPGGASGGAGDG